MIAYTRDMVLQVKELLSRHLDTTEIALRLKMDPHTVQVIIDTINNILT